VQDDGTLKYVWGVGLAYAVASDGLLVYNPDGPGSATAIAGGLPMLPNL
jgi:hypothetical protein